MPEKKVKAHSAARVRLVGAGDIGSNKVHFQVRDEHGNIVGEIHKTPAVGNGLSDKPPFFQKKNLKKLIGALRGAAKMFRKHQIPREQVACYGTAALREFEEAKAVIFETGDREIQRKTKKIARRIKKALSPYRLEVIAEKKESSLVAEVAIHDFCKKPKQEVRKALHQYAAVTVAHCGGRSTEIINISYDKTEFDDSLDDRDGIADKRKMAVEKQEVLRFGVHTHNAAEPECAGDLAPDIQLFADGLKAKWPVRKNAGIEDSLLAVSGGVWRAIGKLACNEGSAVLPRKDAEERLTFLASQNKEYFEKRGEKKRAGHLAAAAQSVLYLIRHTNAQEIIFLKGKMVDVISAHLCDKFLAQLQPQPPQSASPSNQLLPLRA